jgi:hypothetical protein
MVALKTDMHMQIVRLNLSHMSYTPMSLKHIGIYHPALPIRQDVNNNSTCGNGHLNNGHGCRQDMLRTAAIGNELEPLRMARVRGFIQDAGRV